MAGKMTRCPEGHDYDPSKHTAPWCALPQDNPGIDQKTRPVVPPPLPQAAASAPPASPKPGATVRAGMGAAIDVRRDPVVGPCLAKSTAWRSSIRRKKRSGMLPGEASGLGYLNGDMVNSPTQMKADDVVELGQTKLVLIPFCGDKYNWSES